MNAIQKLAAAIAVRVPEMARDSSTNNAQLIEAMIGEYVADIVQEFLRPLSNITAQNFQKIMAEINLAENTVGENVETRVKPKLAQITMQTFRDAMAEIEREMTGQKLPEKTEPFYPAKPPVDEPASPPEENNPK